MGPHRSFEYFGDQSAPGGRKLLAGGAIHIGPIGDNCPDRPESGTEDPLPTDRADLISCPPSGWLHLQSDCSWHSRRHGISDWTSRKLSPNKAWTDLHSLVEVTDTRIRLARVNSAARSYFSSCLRQARPLLLAIRGR